MIGAAGRAALDRDLLAAHATGEGARLVALYAEAGDGAEAGGDASAAAFFRTQAYVFALEAGDPAAERLHGLLKAAGREE